MTPCISRRAAIGLAGAAFAALATPSIGWSSRRKLKVSVFGAGPFEGPFEKNIFPAFTAATGIPVQSVVRPDGEPWIVQLQRAEAAGTALADVSMMSRDAVREGMNGRLWAPLDRSKIPNCAKVKPDYLDAYPDGRLAAVGAVTWRLRNASGAWVISRASRARAEAHAFINFMCRPEIQVSLARGRGWSLAPGPLPKSTARR